MVDYYTSATFYRYLSYADIADIADIVQIWQLLMNIGELQIN